MAQRVSHGRTRPGHKPAPARRPLREPDLDALGRFARAATVDDAGEGLTLTAAGRAPLVRDAVHAFARAHAIDDPRVAASQWSKHYLACVLPAPLAALTLTDLDLSSLVAHARLIVEDGTPTRLAFPSGLARKADPGADRAGAQTRLHHALFHDVVTPTLHAAAEATTVSPRVLWGNAGNLVAWLFDEAEAQVPERAHVARRDAHALVTADASVLGVDARLLRDAVHYEHVDGLGDARPQRVRTTCCLKDRLGGARCYSCPLLTADERVARLRELRSVP